MVNQKIAMQPTNFSSLSNEPPAALYEQVRRALQLWHKMDNENPLEQLLTFHPADAQEPVRQFVNSRLQMALAEMQHLHKDEAHLLQMRYLEGLTAETTAYRLDMSTPNLNKKQRKALQMLCGLLWQKEQAARNARQVRFLNHLEAPTYDRLFGVEKLATRVLQLLTTPQSPWLIMLEGMGGIGKTALADAVMRRAIAQHHFAGYGWVSARQQRFHLAGAIVPQTQPALTTVQLIEQLATQLVAASMSDDSFMLPVIANAETLARLNSILQAAPHLIVIDNLETLADLDALLPTLRRLANPTKFLLTSRASIYNETATYPFAIPELTEADALALVRHEATLRNQPDLAAASTAQLQPIYAAVGGNPLALRLIVGQTHIHSLPSILDDLRLARGEPVQNLYTYIYRQAWAALDERGQEVLLAMLHANPQGDALDFIADVSGMGSDDVRNALNYLVRLNLVDGRGGLNQRRYSIHALTRSFLQEQVLQWRD
ncbi:MAG: NB-ARC domain-containing protein [Caldilineaceae bacterium]